MTIRDARSLIGADVSLTCRNRKGEETIHEVHVFSADFLPLYGPCLVTDDGEVPLDRVVAFELQVERKRA